MNDIADFAQRKEALDPERSFIVQAPAGSGKTELLIQRYLKLLSQVQLPEEIIAITFTRKAAAEMQGRILAALARGSDDTPPNEPHELQTWALAREALKQNEKHRWMLTQNPARFKIQTIDSLCAGLTRQMPLLSEFGAPPQIIDNAEPLYRQAARNTLADLEAGFSWSPAVEALIRHLDNHLEKVENLIVGMLAKRSQWLRHMGGARQREALEAALANIISDWLASVRRQFLNFNVNDLMELCRFAAANLKSEGIASPICGLEELAGLPTESPEDKSEWTGLCELLLTKDGQWRKSVTKNMGFPAPSSVKSGSELHLLYQEKKNLFKQYLDNLSSNEDMACALHTVRLLPDPLYSDSQWHVMEALFILLRAAVAHLKLVFRESGQVDFSEIALRAASALGDPESPTDLTLALDYRISHILVDEFQDTSFTQFDFMERLTSGWTPGDGRTFFAVGDPMQSIYGFREAEVGLFIKARREGLGQIKLHPLTLAVNFRSQKKIVDWVNNCFSQIMPAGDDETTGAVCFSPSVACHDALAGDAVSVYPFVPPDLQAQAAAIVSCIVDAKKSAPDAKIAILVRSRAHLEKIVPAVKSAGISFRAVEIESLKNRPMISDLLSLTRALSHPADRIAWLAVLRAPWCGLTLNDLYALAGQDSRLAMLDLMNDERCFAALSADGQKRLARVRDILTQSVQHRRRKSLRRQVESVWVRLGGPACAVLPSDLEDVPVFLDLLDEHAGTGALPDIPALEAAASALYATSDARADDCLQIMTIHKAKGLEFDIVILPGLDKSPPAESPQLLLWLERYCGGKKDLLLAPISETGADTDKIYNYIKSLHEKKKDLEDTRLLYVAATRAKKHLYLMAGAGIDKENNISAPGKKSLLSKLWPSVKNEFERTHLPTKEAQMPFVETGSAPPKIEALFIRRFAEEFNLPCPPPDADLTLGSKIGSEENQSGEVPTFDWAGEIVRRCGTVIHQWLKLICEDGLEKWPPQRIAAQGHLIRHALIRSGISADRINDATELVTSALVNTVSDEKGRWILFRHKEGACEFALTGCVSDKIINRIIDRTFMDENGVRWIIDYKSGVHSGGSKNDFLEREKMRYFSQMEEYARLMAAQEKNPICLGLYFPQMTGWREWKYILSDPVDQPLPSLTKEF